MRLICVVAYGPCGGSGSAPQRIRPSARLRAAETAVANVRAQQETHHQWASPRRFLLEDRRLVSSVRAKAIAMGHWSEIGIIHQSRANVRIAPENGLVGGLLGWWRRQQKSIVHPTQSAHVVCGQRLPNNRDL